MHRVFMCGAAGALFISTCSTMVMAQMPPDIAEKIAAMGRVIELDKTGKIYEPLHEKEPYARIQVVRDGKSMSMPVTLEAMADGDHENKLAENTTDKPRWGVGIADITPDLREQLRAPDDLHGAVIERVQPGSPSDEAGLQPGEVIVGVNRHETKSAADVQKALAMKELTHNIIAHAYEAGNSGEIMFLGTDLGTNIFAQHQGFRLVDAPLYRVRLRELEQNGGPTNGST